MTSPGLRRRPQSSYDYEPLLGSSKQEKPKPPPKPPLLKSFSSNQLPLRREMSPPSDVSGTGGYFQPGGSSGIGYCLSSVYKAKVGPKTSDASEASIKAQHTSKLKFVKKDESRPSLISLPAKFQVSFQERNKQYPTSVADEIRNSSISPKRSNSVSSTRRPPPPIPVNGDHESSAYPTKSLTRTLSTSCSPTSTRPNSHSPILRASSVSSHPSGPSHSSSSSSLSNASSSSPTFSSQWSASLHAGRLKPLTYAQPPPREMDYTEKEHPRVAFEYLNALRLKGDLCDATLCVNGKTLKAHRVVLAACSQYFESMFVGEFSEPPGVDVIIEEVSEDALETLVEFAYTSNLKLTDKNVHTIVEAADVLQLVGVKGACFKFFKQQMNKSNCIQTWLFAEEQNCTELVEASLRYIESNFVDISKGREFLDLEQHDVVVKIVRWEDLAITAEELVYEAVLAWIRYRPEHRKKHALELFRCVRFPSIPKEYLMHIVDNEPLIQEDPDLLQLLIEALEAHVTMLRGTLKRKKKKTVEDRVKPRAASMAIDVVEIYRQSASLGLRMMGGMDRRHHVFRQGDTPGVFILQVLEKSAAAKTGKLRTGDRIVQIIVTDFKCNEVKTSKFSFGPSPCGSSGLQVSSKDVTSVTHDEAIHALKTSPDPLILHVRHEPPPPGFRELTLVTKPGVGFGFTINGGVSGYAGNPLDDTDEGIFIAQIVPGGAAELDGRLKVGTRILQINSISLIDVTYQEALKVQQSVLDRLHLMVCDGYDPNRLEKDDVGYYVQETIV